MPPHGGIAPETLSQRGAVIAHDNTGAESDESDAPRDIFDRIMSVGPLRRLYPAYRKYKEILLYILFGGLTTVVSFGTFYIFRSVFGIHELIANVLSWIFAVTFAYVTNRLWVFESKAKGAKELAGEAASFYGGRVFTLLVETAMMWVGYSRLHFNYWGTKVVANMVVLILNYVISKLFVFRDKKNEAPAKNADE